jgi:hypothetical protein
MKTADEMFNFNEFKENILIKKDVDNTLKYSKIVYVIEDADPDNVYSINGGIDTVGVTNLKNYGLPGSEQRRYSVLCNCIFPFKYYGTYYTVKELPINKNYLYVINLYSIKYFENRKTIGFKNISPRVIEDVKNNKAKIMLIMATEGESHTWYAPEDFYIIQSWVNELSLPPNSVVYINGNLLSEEIIKQGSFTFKSKGVGIFEYTNKVLDYYPNIINFEPDEKQFLYLNLNRVPRTHRVYMLSELIQAGLYEKGLNSFDISRSAVFKLQDRFTFNHFIERYDPSLLTSASYIYEKVKNILDVDTISNLAVNINLDLHKKTFVDLVTETVVDPNSLFFTEKTWKPVVIGKPFLLLGSNNMLEQMKRYGFKTFDKWFDESYDYAPTLKEKIIIIIKNLERYKNHTPEQLQALRQEMKEVCIHNQNILKQRVEKLYKENGQHFFGACTVATKPILDTLYDVYHNW